MSSLPVFTTPPSEGVVNDAFPIGMAAIMVADSEAARLSVDAMMAWLRTPLKLGQAVFLLSGDGWPLGVATWAYLSPGTAKRMMIGERDLPLLEDWNEGTLVWVTDFIAPYGNGLQLAAALRDALLAAGHTELHFRRRKHKCAPLRNV